MKNRLALLEAVLFTASEPISEEKLQKKLKVKSDVIKKLLDDLEKKYSSPDSGIKLSKIGGYRLVVKEEYAEDVADLTPHADMSRGLLRVLSIIAYHGPVKKSDIVKIVGNRTYEYVKELESRGLIKSERKARTSILITTPQFEEYFSKPVKEELKKIVENNEKKVRE